MKKFYSIVAAGCLFAASTQSNAQCDGQRFHDFVFTGATATTNVIYGNNITFSGSSQDLKMDVYEPIGDTASLRPLIVWAHGGSFVSGSKSGAEMVKVCTDFAKLGYVTASIDYRLYMTNLISIQGPDSVDGGAAVMRATHDARAAVRYFRKNFTEGGNTYRIDTSKIYFAGMSAGSFMGLHLAYMDEWSEFPQYIDTTGNSGPDPQKGLHGGVEGVSGNPGYSSKVKALVDMSGALIDTAVIHAGDTPLISTHSTGDGTVPYGTAMIYLNPPNTYPMQVIDGSATIIQKVNALGIEHCFKTYYNNVHVPEQDSAIYDTSFCLIRNFLEHFTCGVPLNCEFTGKVTGVSEIASKNVSFGVYPNPSSSDITIDLSAFAGKNVDVELYDVMGRKVKGAPQIKAEHYTINRDNLLPGIYSVNVIAGEKMYSKKVIFQ